MNERDRLRHRFDVQLRYLRVTTFQVVIDQLEEKRTSITAPLPSLQYLGQKLKAQYRVSWYVVLIRSGVCIIKGSPTTEIYLSQRKLPNPETGRCNYAALSCRAQREADRPRIGSDRTPYSVPSCSYSYRWALIGSLELSENNQSRSAPAFLASFLLSLQPFDHHI